MTSNMINIIFFLMYLSNNIYAGYADQTNFLKSKDALRPASILNNPSLKASSSGEAYPAGSILSRLVKKSVPADSTLTDKELTRYIMDFNQRESRSDLNENKAYAELLRVFDSENSDLFLGFIGQLAHLIGQIRAKTLHAYNNSDSTEAIDLISMPHQRIISEMIFHAVDSQYYRRKVLEEYAAAAFMPDNPYSDYIRRVVLSILNNYGIGEIIEVTTEFNPIYSSGGIGAVESQYPKIAASDFGLDIKVALPLYYLDKFGSRTDTDGNNIKDKNIKNYNIRWSGKNLQFYIGDELVTVGVYNAFINGQVIIFLDHPLCDSIYLQHKERDFSVTYKDYCIRRILLSKSALGIIESFKTRPGFIIGNDDWTGLIGFYQKEHIRYKQNSSIQDASVITRWHNPVYGKEVPYVAPDGENLFELIARDQDNPYLISRDKGWQLQQAFRHPIQLHNISFRAIAARYSHNLAVSKGLADTMQRPEGRTDLHDIFSNRAVTGIREGIDQRALQRGIFGERFVELLRQWRIQADDNKREHIKKEFLNIAKNRKRLAKADILLFYFSRLFGFSDRLLHRVDIDADKYFSDEKAPWIKSILTKHGKSSHMPLFLFMGRMASQKGGQFLLGHLPGDHLNIMERIIYDYPDAKFIFVGPLSPGDDYGAWIYESLKDIAKYKQDNIAVRGPIKHGSAEWLALNAACDAGIMPSLNEPCGMSNLEQISSGMAVISSNVEGLLDGVVDLRYYPAIGNGIKFDLSYVDSNVDSQKATEDLYAAIIAYLKIFYADDKAGNNSYIDNIIYNCLTTDNDWPKRISENISYLRAIRGVDSFKLRFDGKEVEVMPLDQVNATGVVNLLLGDKKKKLSAILSAA